MAPKKSPTRQPLSSERILEAAIIFADEYGVEALTMRKVATTLGFGVMSLYNHVANKEEMLTGMLDIVVAQITPPAVAGDWKATMRASAASANAVLLKHHWAAAEWSRRMPGPARIRYMDSILRVLTEAELRPDLVYRGYHAITMHIVGFTLQQVGYLQFLDADFEQIANSFLSNVEGEHPYIAEHVRAHMTDDDHGDEFGFVLDLILDGLERSDAAD